MRGTMHTLLHLRLLIRWVFFSLLIGVLLGFIGAAFVWCIGKATAIRTSHTWCYLLLPAGGVLIVWLYRVTHDKHDKGTNMVLASLRSEAELPMQMAPFAEARIHITICNFCFQVS